MDSNDTERRLLLALVLSAAVFFLWTRFFAPPPRPKPASTEAIPEAAAVASPEATPMASQGASVGEAPPMDFPLPEVKIPLKTEQWTSVLMSTDGALRSTKLTGYFAEPKVQPVWTWLFGRITGKVEGGWQPYAGGEDNQTVLGADSSLGLAGVGPIGLDGPYEVVEDSVGQVLRRKTASGVVISKRVSPGEQPFTMKMEIRFQNTGSSPVPGVWVGAALPAHQSEGRFDNATAAVGHVDGGLESLQDLKKVNGAASITETGPVHWVGLGSRYFLAALSSEAPVGDTLVFDDLSDGRVGVFAVDSAPLAVGETRVESYTLFVGPKDLDLLSQVGTDLDDAVELGFFGFFAKILLFLLEVMQKGVVNWGVAIIALTFLVKVVFFPLTQKSFVSSRRMQALQPQLNELKEVYKDDQAKLQQATMKLFQDNEVNPLGGCLPTLVQMPVWFALYSVLLSSVELYNSSFLYLRDLTAVDPYGVLPTVVAILFFLQQLMTPMAGMDPTQQKMMRLMPILFAFFMYSLPSGLVLYITVNSVLSIAQMWAINRMIPAVAKPA